MCKSSTPWFGSKAVLFCSTNVQKSCIKVSPLIGSACTAAGKLLYFQFPNFCILPCDARKQISVKIATWVQKRPGFRFRFQITAFDIQAAANESGGVLWSVHQRFRQSSTEKLVLRLSSTNRHQRRSCSTEKSSKWTEKAQMNRNRRTVLLRFVEAFWKLQKTNFEARVRSDFELRSCRVGNFLILLRLNAYKMCYSKWVIVVINRIIIVWW